ncbi:ATP-binding protein [Roseobacter sinensis]|uniref:histidine kinase n=1 Tax=Roseobacter sinensis TaxID=2931391 RepID=A0ABT3BII6_9RHOB|nr:ATP-binding protein [Roseobacter sp. WL0113]MCV3273390.1 ATP-binding protein [Roseobacter sp. WL0113]
MMAGETGVETFFSPAMNVSMISGFSSLPGSGWGVMVPQPISELEEVADAFNRDALIIMSLGLALSFILAAAASFLLSSRIQFIEAHVSDLGAGHDVQNRMLPRSPIALRELKSLQAGVNAMARSTALAREEIQDRNRDLERSNADLRREIEERKTAQTQRSESEARFKSLFENAPIPIREEDVSGIKKAIDALDIADHEEFSRYLDDNPDFLERCRDLIVVVDANRASQAMHKYPSKELLKSSVVRTLSPDSMRVFRQTLEAIHAGKTSMSYELSIYPKEGDACRIAGNWTVLPGYEETYARLLLTSVDITERLKSEERLHKAQKMEAVGQLTGGIAHDFNNLLTVIGGNIELIVEDPHNASDYVQPVLRAVKQGGDLTQRLLAFSRQQPLTPRVIDLVHLVSEMIELFRRTLGDNVEISFKHAPDLWPARADPNQVQNALLNLAINARDAMPDGGALQITCENAHREDQDDEELEEGDYVKISVADTGTGMAPEVLSHVFEPFYTTKEVGMGSGLGLSMVYGFAKQSRGHAEIISQPGVGTTVSVLLPRADVPPEMTMLEEASKWRQRGRGQKILVLEDQPDVRAYLIRVLKLMGYEPLPASDAKSAHAVLTDHQDIVVALCDIMLPGGVSGIDFARSAIRMRPDLELIFMSGYPPRMSDEADVGEAESVVLNKPIDTVQLSEVLYRKAKR